MVLYFDENLTLAFLSVKCTQYCYTFKSITFVLSTVISVVKYCTKISKKHFIYLFIILKVGPNFWPVVYILC